MIDIKEIRIGNVLNGHKHKLLVEKIGGNKICCILNDEPFDYLASSIFPTPISEDILLCLGFKKEVEDITKDKRYRLRLNGFCIDINKYSNTFGRDYSVHIDNLCCNSVLSGDIQYLHQLQNYIYDSTKQELDITNIL